MCVRMCIHTSNIHTSVHLPPALSLHHHRDHCSLLPFQTCNSLLNREKPISNYPYYVCFFDWLLCIKAISLGAGIAIPLHECHHHASSLPCSLQYCPTFLPVQEQNMELRNTSTHTCSLWHITKMALQTRQKRSND